MSDDLVTARVRGGVVGGFSAVTGIVAHASAHGMLPTTSTLLIVVAAAVAIGATVTAAPRLPSLPVLLVGQGIIHLLLTLLSGHHHDMFAPSMVLTHGLGTLAALAAIAALQAVALSIVGVVALVVSLLTFRGTRYSRATPPAVRVIDASEHRHLHLGTAGRRGPPAFAQ